MDPNTTLHDVRQLASIVLDDSVTNESRAAHGRRLAELIETLDEWLSTGGSRPTPWQTFHRRTRLVGRDDATHPRELPDPVDEAAYARRLTGTAALNPDELEELEELLEPVGWDERVVPQRPADEVAARRAARENT